jgi:NRPS condensation-like uncharacterized protein
MARTSLEAPQRIPATPSDLVVQSWQSSGEMVIELELAFDGRLDEQVLARAAELLLEVEPLLGSRLVPDASTPHWERLPRSSRDVLTVASTPAEYEAVRRTGLDATRGAQVVLCLLPGEPSDRLLIKMSHVAGDGVGLQLLARRLASLYSELVLDPAYRPRPAGVPARDFAQIRSRISRRTYARVLWDFAWFIVPRLLPRRSQLLPAPAESRGPWVPVIRRLPATRAAFLSRYGKARGATLNDVFLAASYRALASVARWDGSSALRIAITVDLRRWCLPPTHTSPAICNLASFDCPFLIRALGRSFDETLANVTALMRRRKRSKPGLALALVGPLLVKVAGSAKGVHSADRKPGPKSGNAMSLSNEGPLDESALTFGELRPVAAHILPPFIELPGLHVCLSGYGGELTLAAVTPENGAPLVGRFLDTLLEELPPGEATPVGRRR